MIEVQRKQDLSLRITRIQQESSQDLLDIYLYIPAELRLKTELISEESLYHSVFLTRRTYYSATQKLPEVHQQLTKNSLAYEHYRTSLSVYAYQYVTALEQTLRNVIIFPLNEGENLEQYAPVIISRIEAHLELIENILHRFRRSAPTFESLYKYFINIDNYLSWFTEQQLLSLVSEIPTTLSFQLIRQQILKLSQREADYRFRQRYNSAQAMASPARMSNKMRLLRRLIEFPITLKDRSKALGGGEQRAIKAVVTGTIMMIISILVLKARNFLGDVTFWFFVVLAILYAMREILREDLRNTLWRWIRKGRPKWRRRYQDPESNQIVGNQREWFSYRRPNRIPENIRHIRRSNVSQREELVLHYRSQTRMLPTRFLTGYAQTRELITVDLSVLAKQMTQGSYSVFVNNNSTIRRIEVEKRYQFILIISRTEKGQKPQLQRWKIVLNRNQIIALEKQD